MNLHTLTDDELLSVTVKTTDLEIELSERLRLAMDNLDQIGPFEHLDFINTANVLKTLTEFGITNNGALYDKLQRADKFLDIAKEAGDTLSRLAILASQTH